MARATNEEYLAKLRAQLAEAEAKAAARAAAERDAQEQKLKSLKTKLKEQQAKKKERVAQVTKVADEAIEKTQAAIYTLVTSMNQVEASNEPDAS